MKTPKSPSKRINSARRRKGFTLFEFFICIMLLSVCTTMLAQLAALAVKQRRNIESRQAALDEAENLLERATTAPWDSLTPEMKVPPEVQARLGARLTHVKVALHAEPLEGDADAKRIDVTIQFGEEGVQRPVRLSTWVWRAPPGANP